MAVQVLADNRKQVLRELFSIYHNVTEGFRNRGENLPAQLLTGVFLYEPNLIVMDVMNHITIYCQLYEAVTQNHMQQFIKVNPKSFRHS